MTAAFLGGALGAIFGVLVILVIHSRVPKLHRSLSVRAMGLDAPLTSTASVSPLLLGTRPRWSAARQPIEAHSGQAGYVVDGGLFGEATVRVASCRGRDHGAAGEFRQDAYALGQSRDGRLLFLAVSDGVGSTRYAELASRYAARGVVRLLRKKARQDPPHEWPWDQILHDLAVEISQALARTSEAVDAMATLTLAVISARASDRTEVVVVSVGDSPAYILRHGDLERLAQAEDSSGGTLAGSGTDALPAHADRFRLVRKSWSATDALILATDGFSDALGDIGTSPLAAHVQQHWQTPPDLLTFLRDVDFQLATYGDDRTVIALWDGLYDEKPARK